MDADRMLSFFIWLALPTAMTGPPMEWADTLGYNDCKESATEDK